MSTPSAPTEAARIQALLARLDPRPAATCGVPGCVHAHAGAPPAPALPALAA